LIRLLKLKDRRAFEYLYDNYAPAIFAIILKIVKEESESEEVLQDVFLKYWNKTSGEVHIDIGNLPKALEGMQYQLWALKDGQPIDAGVFEISDVDKIQKVKSITAAQAYAVTLEKRGGSVSPSLEAMYVFGGV